MKHIYKLDEIDQLVITCEVHLDNKGLVLSFEIDCNNPDEAILLYEHLKSIDKDCEQMPEYGI